MPKKIEDRLAELQKKKREVENKIKQLKMRITKERHKIDTRRKIILGALVLHEIEHGNDALLMIIRDRMEGFVQERDAKLFYDTPFNCRRP